MGGVLADSSSPLHVLRTQYFDIIFPEESRPTAEKISSVCDEYYLEITKNLGTEAYQRFPVTITRSVEDLNAYYTPLPYNRIVLYDTLPGVGLDVYEKSAESVFYHELTHAVTYNMKSKKYKVFSFFADVMNPAWLSLTTFWSEGATVSFESKGRGGRLNDPFSTQIVNQAKIEGHFPSWRDVTGARDTFPGGNDAYMFGGMFASYLQETYGLEKYAQFWKKAGTETSLSFVAGVFKKTYGFSVGKAWSDFENSIETSCSEKKVKPLSKKKSRITAMDFYFDKESGEKKIAYFDKTSSSLRLMLFKKNGKKKNKKLLAITGITRVAFSPDGKKLALSRTVDRKNLKCVTGEYDIKKGRYKENDLNERRDAYFRLKNGKMELESIRFEGYKASGKGVILSSEEEIPFSPVALDDNLYAAIIKDGLAWKIRFFDSKKIIRDYDFEGKILHELHIASSDSDSFLLSFAWAKLGEGGKMLSRSGFARFDRETLEGKFYFQKENSFAGVKSSVPFFLDDGKIDFYAVMAEYDRNPLYRIEMRLEDFYEESFSEKNEVKSKNDSSSVFDSSLTCENESDGDEDKTEENEPHEISYNSLRYYKKGMIIPFLGIVPIYNHYIETDSTTILGMTLLSSNPWGDKQITFSGGYDFSYEKTALSLSFSGGDDSLAYSLGGTCVFDKEGFMQTMDSALLSKVLWRGKVSKFSVGAEGNFFYGKQIIDEEDFEDNWDDSFGIAGEGLGFIELSNIHKVSPSYFGYAGLALKPFVLGSYRDSENLIFEDKYINAGASAELRLPLLIPFIFKANLFPSRRYAATGSAKAILLDLEIHKGIPALSLFAQRLVLSAVYSGKISYNYFDYDELWNVRYTDEIFRNIEKEDYSDALQVGADFYISPNTGFFANPDYQFALGYAFVYRPNPKLNEKGISFGLTASMNY